MSDEEKPSRLTRRQLLRGAAAVSVVSLLPGCDGDDPSTDAGVDAGPPMPEDGGPPPGPLPPRERTYATFEHGVASGDPLTDAVILWTRVTPGTPGAPDPESVDVTWEIATDVGFADVVASDATTADASRDFTVKVDATGLSAGTTYYYRFSALGETSPIGRTRTAPDGDPSRLRFAMCSCASLGHGFLHGYRHMAARADLDAVIHLGDYIYEYGTGNYGNAREYEPPHEIVSLADYRARYSQYRREPSLAEAHRQHPFIVVWDDHETTNDSWSGGAENHQPESEGSWEDRLAVATQAYREWMPIRDDGEPRRLWRRLGYGSLVDLLVLDTRIWEREQQTESLEAPETDDPDRQLLGADQEAWLLERLEMSTARWKVIGQQVMMAPVTGFSNPDQWDGYPAARERLLGAIRDGAIDDVVVLTGDIHSSWAWDVPLDPAGYDPDTGDGAVAVEVVTPGISSPGFPDIGADRLAMSLRDQNPHLQWTQVTRRGYVVLDFDGARMQADWFHTGDVAEEADETHEAAASFATDTGANHLVAQDGPVDDASDAPPLAP
ncbi:MAG TPA: alkaline phosphatase D family protein [Sandaracinaceae bacterium LLY-WYZ-13_1]|nr:alkaline phosphatase D family protein [Sandaracinaceae bacterium LLY-WYZ-13_1]